MSITQLSDYDRRRLNDRRCKGCGGRTHDRRNCPDPLVRARFARDKALARQRGLAAELAAADAEVARLEAELSALLAKAKDDSVPDPRVVPFRARRAADGRSEVDG